jgi:hypothetical protein
MTCYDQAAAFGWKERNPQIASMRDGDWLVGHREPDLRVRQAVSRQSSNRGEKSSPTGH